MVVPAVLPLGIAVAVQQSLRVLAVPRPFFLHVIGRKAFAVPVLGLVFEHRQAAPPAGFTVFHVV